MKKHLLLTGGAGFIGHHTVEHVLRNTDWNITVLDRLTYAGNLNRLTDIECWEKEKSRVRFYYHDFRSPITGRNVQDVSVQFGEPHYIIHMGAESHVDKSMVDPGLFAESNVLGTVNMLILAKILSVEKYIQVSTDEVYGPALKQDGELILHKEGDPHRPGNPYSASKAGAEDFVKSFANTYGVHAIITNTMNNFGERQDPEKFIPRVIAGLYKNEKIIAHVKTTSEGKVVDISSRCWLHARNHADALLFLLNAKTNPGDQFNVTGEHHSVTQVIGTIAEAMKKKAYDLEYVDFHSFRPGHDMHYGLDGTKLKNMGWTAPFDYQKSLENLVKWSIDKKHIHWLGIKA